MTGGKTFVKAKLVLRYRCADVERFLWIFFQLADLCDAPSDHTIRSVLRNLPEGLHGTYERILLKIAKRPLESAAVGKMFRWVACAKRPLRIEELQEAVAFDASDEKWDESKIPDADKIISYCFGLIVRDNEDGIVRYAHYSVLQYLTEAAVSSKIERFCGTSTAALLCFQMESADSLVSDLCVAYLCFSDFEMSLTKQFPEPKMTSRSIFGSNGPTSIPSALGLRRHPFSLAYKFFGGHTDISNLEIDLTKNMNIRRVLRRTPPSLVEKYALLDYVLEFWVDHRHPSNKSNVMQDQFRELCLYKELPFEHRPWGRNSHFGPFGCRACPPHNDQLDSLDLMSSKLRYIGLVHWAAQNGRADLLKLVDLEPYGYHERYCNETLLTACRQGHREIVDAVLVGMKIGINLADGLALDIVSATGDYSILNSLLSFSSRNPEKGYNISEGSFKLLQMACLKSHFASIDELLAWGVSPDIKDEETGKTVLHVAAERGEAEIVTRLIRTTSDINMSSLFSGETALHYASSNGHVGAVNVIIHGGALVDIGDACDETALIKASKNGFTEVVDILLGAGANWRVESVSCLEYPHSSDVWIMPTTKVNLPVIGALTNSPPCNLTAVHYAAANGHEKIVKRLCLPGFQQSTSEFNKTLVDLAATFGQLEVLKYLFNSQLLKTLGAKNMLRDTLAAAVYYGHMNIVSLLLNELRLPDPNTRDSRGLTPVMYAATSGRLDILDLLVDRGAGVFKCSYADLCGTQAIHIAAGYGHLEIMEYLVAFGADVNARDEQGQTPLHYVAKLGSLSAVKGLIDLGATFDPDYCRMSPIEIAARCNNIQCFDLLVKESASNRPLRVRVELRAAIALAYGNDICVKALKDHSETLPKL